MTPCDHNRLPCQGFIWKCQTERISRPGWMRQGTEPSSQTRRIHVMCWNQAANDLICKFASIIVLFTGLCSHGAPFRTSQQFFAFAVPTWTFWVSLKCATKCTPYTALHITTHPCTQHNRTSPFCGLENLSHSPSYTILHHPTPCCSSSWHWRHDSGNSTRGGTTGCNSDGCWLHDLHMFLDVILGIHGIHGALKFQ